MRSIGSNSFKGRRGRRGSSLSEDLEKRVASYVAAASAAEVGSRARSPEAVQVIARATVGAGLLLGAGPASAHIVYTPAYTHIFGQYNLDLNHDGITDATFRTQYGKMAYAGVTGNVLGKIVGVLSGYGAPYTCRVASALPAGHRIGPGSRFGGYNVIFLQEFAIGLFPPYFDLACGIWPSTAFLGLEFTAQGQNHFGWARLNLTNGATLTGYAYETEPNKPIRAGDMGPVADVRVPQMHSAPPTTATLRPATLGMLALGSAGLDIWRKEQ